MALQNDYGDEQLAERTLKRSQPRKEAQRIMPSGAQPSDRPQSIKVTQPPKTKLTPPSTAVSAPSKTGMGGTAESTRDTSISAALMKGAAMVPPSRNSGLLRGVLSGASVGMDIENALNTYRASKNQNTAQNALVNMAPAYNPAPNPVSSSASMPVENPPDDLASKTLKRKKSDNIDVAPDMNGTYNPQ